MGSVSSSDVMRAWFQRVWSERDASAIEELLHPEAEVYGLGPDPVIGPDGFRDVWNGMQDAFSVTQIEVVDAVEAADDGTDIARCWVRCEGSLTVDGTPIPLEGGAQCEVKDGQIVRCWNYWDYVGFMAAMGRLPADVFARACAGECFDSPAAS